MSQLKKLIQAQENEIAFHRAEIFKSVQTLKQHSVDTISSSNALIWSAITGFFFAEFFHPSARNILIGFWPLLRKFGQPLYEKVLTFINPKGDEDEK
ncbi:MAG: hypothetical protein Q7V63_07575 [Gammaproteobacteria bacterium]|nr:hypothetical protein [Gammaproteobacteria bacterium]